MKRLINKLWLYIKKRSASFYVLSITLSLIFVGAIWLFYAQSYKNQLPKNGVIAPDEQFPLSNQDAYKNLDLKIVGKFHFDGASILKTKNLGIENGIDESIISFKVPADNLTEYALMTQPETARPADGFPIIILCHGYVNPQDYVTTRQYIADMEEYSRAGFIVIKPDFRGQGLSRHSGSPEGAYYSTAYNTDLMSLIASVKKTAYMNSRNISLWGHSMGAYIALRAAVISPDIQNLIVLSGPVGNVQDMFRSYLPISDRDNPIAYNIRQAVLLRYGTPLTKPAFWNLTSPLSYLGQLKANVQIYAGSDDTLVPPHFSADLDRSLNRIHKPHGYFVFKGGNHGLVSDRPQIYLHTLQLLRSKNTSG